MSNDPIEIFFAYFYKALYVNSTIYRLLLLSPSLSMEFVPIDKVCVS